MASAPLFHSPSHQDDDEATPLLGGLATTSPTRPFATNFHPTLFTRTLSFILLLPSFIILVSYNGPHYAASIIFLSFALARQLVILISFFGSQIVVIHIEVVHERLKSVSAKAQEKWIKKITALCLDGVILIGLLVTLSINAHEIAVCSHSSRCDVPRAVMAAVILGFIAFGLLLPSAPDCGNPALITMAVAIEKPGSGLLKFASSVLYGEVDPDSDDNDEEAVAGGSLYTPVRSKSNKSKGTVGGGYGEDV